MSVCWASPSWPSPGAARRVVISWRIPDVDLYTPASSPDDLLAFMLVDHTRTAFHEDCFPGNLTCLSVLFCCDNPPDLVTIADISVVTAVNEVIRYGLVEVGLIQIDRSFRVAGVLVPEVAKLLEGVCTVRRDILLLQTWLEGFPLLLFHEEQKVRRRKSLVRALQLVIKSAQSLSDAGLQGRRRGPERAGCIGSLSAGRRRGPACCGGWTVDVCPVRASPVTAFDLDAARRRDGRSLW